MGASGVNWNNVPHESILSQINGGAGAGPVVDAAASYRRLAMVLRAADQDLRDALDTARAAWEGRAATDMQTASTPLAVWADEADQLAVATGSAAQVFGDQFSDTRGLIPPVVDVPSGSWVDGTGLSAVPGVTTDRERAEVAADAAHHEAARRMEGYDNASYDTIQTQYFSPPPTVVLEVPPPAAGSGQQAGGPTSGPGAQGGTGGYSPPGGPATPAPQWQLTGTQPTATAPAGGGASPPGPGGAPPVGGSNPGGPAPSGLPGAPPVTGLPVPGTFGPGPFGSGSAGSNQGAHGRSSGGTGHGFGGSGAGGAQPNRVMGPGGVMTGPEVESRPAPGRPGVAGVAGTGFGPMAGRASGDEDTEHRRPDYLVETEDVWGDGTRVAPAVIGDRPVR